MEEPKTLKDWREVGVNHFELCEKLHRNSNLIPKELMSIIENLIYNHFEP